MSTKYMRVHINCRAMPGVSNKWEANGMLIFSLSIPLFYEPTQMYVYVIPYQQSSILQFVALANETRQSWWLHFCTFASNENNWHQVQKREGEAKRISRRNKFNHCIHFGQIASTWIDTYRSSFIDTFEKFSNGTESSVLRRQRK